MTSPHPTASPQDISASLTQTRNANLTHLNTMHLACVADELIEIHDEAQVASLFKKLEIRDTPYLVLSGGSNVLLPLKLKATVIRPIMQGINIISETKDGIEIEVMAGENWHNLVLTTVNNGWFGLENLALIPGLTGAAPVQNIGAYGVQLEDHLTHVRAFHMPSQSWHVIDLEACGFGYRESKFKREPNEWLITRVGFHLHKGENKVKADYGDVANLAAQHANQRLMIGCQERQTGIEGKSDTEGKSSGITPVDVMTAVIELRQSKLPDPLTLPNCGSFFKNPIIPTTQFLALKAQYPNIVGYPSDDNNTKVAAGWLIDNAGLKGNGIPPILTHQKQALVLVNHNYQPNNSVESQQDNLPATQSDVLVTQRFIQHAVADKYHIRLEREPVLIDTLARYNATS